MMFLPCAGSRLLRWLMLCRQLEQFERSPLFPSPRVIASCAVLDFVLQQIPFRDLSQHAPARSTVNGNILPRSAVQALRHLLPSLRGGLSAKPV